MSIALIASATALFAAASATPNSTAATPNAPAPAPATAPVADEDARYCVRFQMTGISPPRRACKTREMWIGTQGYDPLAPSK
ncbi:MULTISPECIES: hypothetical protein [unclassified Sphingomonas]|uniref:hypothetical protein n=1 Tax=unclassified Sphingomonas TaxID=196159 RepID=UPI00215177EE|nr:MULTISPECIES: hypothetical protein [unclassified Sphingomonas]MCR5871753.1 hypothetical protein [Sphingomonas sp. J344]UUX99962.1 hypothetical protein LRS08_02095 [Sphingomonas sp. J315]